MSINGSKEFVSSYKKKLVTLVEEIEDNVVDEIIKKLEFTHSKKAKIYIIGNGGSSSTASHMANDLSIGLSRRNIRHFNIESLSDNHAVCTAIANDIGYENIFYSQIKEKISSNDLLIAISCSGDSPNIIKAVEYAKLMKTSVVGLTGFSGGKLKELSEINFHIKTNNGEYGLVEDLHLILNHLIYSYYISTNENYNNLK